MIEKLGITPGPWQINRSPEFSNLPGRVFITINGSGHRIVGDDGMSGDTKEDDNNAKLIAAAPEMLEALIDVGFDSEKGGLIDWLNFKDYFMPIIEKATGRTWDEVKELLNE